MANEQLKRRRNFLPTVALLVVLTAIWLIIFFLVPPEQPFAQHLFITITLLSVFFFASLISGNIRRGILATLGVTIFMFLNYYQVGNWLNLVLVAGILFTVEYYLSR